MLGDCKHGNPMNSITIIICVCGTESTESQDKVTDNWWWMTNSACNGCNFSLFLLNISLGCQNVCNWCIEGIYAILNTKAMLVLLHVISEWWP